MIEWSDIFYGITVDGSVFLLLRLNGKFRSNIVLDLRQMERTQTQLAIFYGAEWDLFSVVIFFCR